MGTKFPLCESVGLSPLPVVDQSTWNISSEIFINAKAVEALLAKGVRVPLSEYRNYGSVTDFLIPTDLSTQTHSGLIIDIKPIANKERRRELTEAQVRVALAREVFEHITEWNESYIDSFIDRLFGEEG